MDEMFRDFSPSARTGSPRTDGTGNSSRRESPSYMNDFSRRPAASQGSTRARSGAQSSARSRTGGRTYGNEPYVGGTASYYRASASSRNGRSGSGSRSSGSGSRSSGSGPSRRKRQLQKRSRAIFFGFLVLLLLFAATIFVIVRSCNPSGPIDPSTIDTETATYADEVYINGILVSEKTLAEVRDILMPGIEQTVSRIAISLTGEMGGESFYETISGADMNISTDIEQVLLDALVGGRNKSYNTTLSIDYEALDRRIAAINSALSFGPADATFSLTMDEDGKPNLVYTEGRVGMGIDIPATEQLVREALDSGNYQASLTPQLTQQQPSITVDDLKQQITLIGSCTTEYRNKGLADWTEEKKQTTLNRAFNVEKAAGLINGNVIQPGEVWSYNDTVGDRNEKNGWKEANAIVGGETYRLEYGGGVCQVSSTLYNALLEANIEIVYRRKHSIPADYVPLGLDATVDTGHIDFKFRNNTDYPLYLFAYTNVSKESSRWSDITVLLYGQALPEGVTYKPRAVQLEETVPDEPIVTYDPEMLEGEEVVTVEARNGYKVEVYLDKFLNGELVDSTYLYTDEYAAIRQKVTVGTLVPATPTPKPTAEPTPPPASTPEPVFSEDDSMYDDMP